MLIYINDKPENFQSSFHCLNDLLASIRQENPKGIAVAVNGEIISRAVWENFSIHEHDKITLIQATQGG
jgi:sulfur carrier protein